MEEKFICIIDENSFYLGVYFLWEGPEDLLLLKTKRFSAEMS